MVADAYYCSINTFIATSLSQMTTSLSVECRYWSSFDQSSVMFISLQIQFNIPFVVDNWRLRGNIIRTAPCWVVWNNVYSQQHTHVSSSYRSSRLDLSHWNPYAMHRGGCLELYYCNMVEWSWWDSSLICETNWFPSVRWHCWFGHMTCKNRFRYDL